MGFQRAAQSWAQCLAQYLRYRVQLHLYSGAGNCIGQLSRVYERIGVGAAGCANGGALPRADSEVSNALQLTRIFSVLCTDT